MPSLFDGEYLWRGVGDHRVATAAGIPVPGGHPAFSGAGIAASARFRRDDSVGFPEDRLPDGGSGGAERVVPGDSERNWAAAIGSRAVRMKDELVKNTDEYGGGVFTPGTKGALEPKMASKHLPRREKTIGGL